MKTSTIFDPPSIHPDGFLTLRRAPLRSGASTCRPRLFIRATLVKNHGGLGRIGECHEDRESDPGDAKGVPRSYFSPADAVAVLRPDPQGVDVGPQARQASRSASARPPGLRLADSAEVLVFPPVLEGLDDEWPGLRRSRFEVLRPGRQLGRSHARACSRSFAFAESSGAGLSLPRSAPGQRGGVGGVVASLGLAILGQFGVGVESVAPELRPPRRGAALLS